MFWYNRRSGFLSPHSLETLPPFPGRRGRLLRRLPESALRVILVGRKVLLRLTGVVRIAEEPGEGVGSEQASKTIILSV